MSENKTQKVDPNIINKLQSKNAAEVLTTVQTLKESGHSAYLPALFDTLHQSDDELVKKAITNLLAQLKQRDAVPLIIDAIENKKYENEQNLLVAACWENGLDYSNHFSLFIDLIIEKDFLTAFEAHTVIMNMSGRISQEIADKESKKLNEALKNSDGKEQLINDVLEFIPVFVEGIEPQSF